MKDVKLITDINKRAFEISAGIKLLGNVSWPSTFEDQFLAAYKKGRTHLPEVLYKKIDYSEQKSQLNSLLHSFTATDPLELFTKRTLESYLDAIELNACVGTKDFTALSKKVFGVPGDLLPGSKTSNIQAAEQLVNLAMDFTPPFIQDQKFNIEAEDIKAYMDRRIKGAFKGAGPQVVIVDRLSAKATATPRTIKIKAGANFSQYDFKQLFYHEIMTHSLTALNGESQPILKCLGRGALRTLKTQEGLATFAELITGSMDIQRLKRLALRILAIDIALNGASFLDVFEFFLSKGQGESESFSATHRVFRGGFPDKNIVFTKDCIYLEGLINVHTFFRWAMKHGKLDLCHLLFCGRLSLDDVFDLEEAYNYQWVAPPSYTPAWFEKIEGLAGTLSFSLLANLIRVDIAEKTFQRAG